MTSLPCQGRVPSLCVSPCLWSEAFITLCVLKAGKTRFSTLPETAALNTNLLTHYTEYTSVCAHPHRTKIWQWQITQLLRNDTHTTDLLWETNLSRVNLSVNSGFFHCCHLKAAAAVNTHPEKWKTQPCFVCGMWREERAVAINMFLFALSVELWRVVEATQGKTQ